MVAPTPRGNMAMNAARAVSRAAPGLAGGKRAGLAPVRRSPMVTTRAAPPSGGLTLPERRVEAYAKTLTPASGDHTLELGEQPMDSLRTGAAFASYVSEGEIHIAEDGIYDIGLAAQPNAMRDQYPSASLKIGFREPRPINHLCVLGPKAWGGSGISYLFGSLSITRRMSADEYFKIFWDCIDSFAITFELRIEKLLP